MPYVADLEKAKGMIGTLVGDGQCVTFVHAAVATPPASLWKMGEKVRGDQPIRAGTVIATFDPDGCYGNHTDGRSHAAIYLGQDVHGIQVLDQWSGHTRQPVHQRTIRFKNGQGLPVDDGDQFSVAE
jgi:hypothetical protein